ncbi:glycoside hydrolase family 24 [Devosia soli]|uniref:Glycoside hydrolase family 24 n=1 Tax=Devosia soli TaxID=361041 RepID=A0A0F5LG06_9HYPH|nr:glycoside hydrolase family 24 [Devosia soli]
MRFPLDIALGARGGPERKTDVVSLAGGGEQRNGRWAHSRRKYNAGYGVKSRADMQAVLAFFEERRGRLHGFLWRDGIDHSSGGAVPLPDDQAMGTADGATKTFQLVKRYGAAFDPYLRTIAKPVAGSVRLAIDGGEITSGWTVDATSGVVTFSSPPAMGALVTAGFLFDVPVRFDTDRLDIEWTHFDAAEAPSIPLVEILP